MEFFDALLLYIISLILSVAFHINFYFRGQKTKLLRSFLYMQGMIFIWIFGKVFIMLSPSRELSWFFTIIQYIGVIFLGNVFLSFAYYYFNNKRISLKKQVFLIGISAFNYGMLITNPWHHLFFSEFFLRSKEYGPIFYFHTFYSYLLILMAYFFLFRGLYSSNQDMNRSAKMLSTLGLILPMFVNVLHVFKLTHIEMDITPIMFNVTFLVLGYASYRYKFLDIKKIATYTVFENMQEGIIVVNKNQHIVKLNKIMTKYIKDVYDIAENLPFEKLMLDSEKFIINHADFYSKLKDYLLSDLSACQFLCILKSGENLRTFLLHCEKIKGHRKQDTIYTILRFVEITKYKKADAQLEAKNEELSLINKALSEELSVLKRLAIAKERNRISKELHDILGHSLTMVISMLEVGKALMKVDQVSAKEKVFQTRAIVREGFVELKKSVEGKASIQMDIVKLIEEIGKMVQEVEALGTKVEVINRYDYDIIEPKYYDAIYRMCQEGLTNAIKHGKPKNITIGLKFSNGDCDLIIADDGEGCSKLIKGNGLLGMEQRVKELKGSLSCGSPEGEGFNLHIKVPLV